MNECESVTITVLTDWSNSATGHRGTNRLTDFRLTHLSIMIPFLPSVRNWPTLCHCQNCYLVQVNLSPPISFSLTGPKQQNCCGVIDRLLGNHSLVLTDVQRVNNVWTVFYNLTLVWLRHWPATSCCLTAHYINGFCAKQGLWGFSGCWLKLQNQQMFLITP